MKKRFGAVLGALTVMTVVAGFAGRVEAAAITDVTFRGNSADDAVGPIGGNDSMAVANNYFGGAWEATVKDEGAPGALNGYLGINWTLTAQDGQKTGTWSLSLVDPAPANLPVTVDLFVVLKASNSWAGYLFQQETFVTEGSNPGTFAITFLNNGGNIPNLSHMSIYLREADPPCPDCPDPDPIPEPTSLALMGLGLLGAGVARRRVRR